MLNGSTHCVYPPCVSPDVDITRQVGDQGERYVIRNRATLRYFLLKPLEFHFFQQFDGTRNLADIMQGSLSGTTPRVSKSALVKFLSKCDAYGLLQYQGGQAQPAPGNSHQELYPRFKLFNPQEFLNWLDLRFGWVFSPAFITISFFSFLLTFLGFLLRADEVALYVTYTYSTYGLLTVLLFTLLITITHEFAHGLACKHFGGDVQEMGVLMIFYVLPAFYCNVSDIYRIGKKRERLYVIAAGIYWQLLVSAIAAFIWLVATPYTALADFMFLAFLGGTCTILINCNPLIKLDGYYALSQLLGVQNLQMQSGQYVRALLARLIHGGPARSCQSRPLVFIVYWLCSSLYSLFFIYLILNAASGLLMDIFGFAGVLLTLWLSLLLSKRWWKPLVKNLRLKTMSTQTDQLRSEPLGNQRSTNSEAVGQPSSKFITVRRSLVIKSALALLFIVVMVMPWEASTSSDCTLRLPPGREDVARANVNAVIAEVFVQPGDAVTEGAKLARLANPDLEDRLTQINGEIQQLITNNTRLEDELKVRGELLLSANLKESDRKRLLDELQGESLRISSAYQGNSLTPTSSLPAAIAILQSEVELKQTELEHNRHEVERYKKLIDQGLIGAQIYDRAVATMKVSDKEVQSAKAKLEAAIVEHRRSTSSLETGSLVAETEARAARSTFEILIAELHANRQQLASLQQRQEILRRKYDGMNVTAPRSGVILGEDLRKLVGKEFTTGEEICRVGDLDSFQLTVEVNEREISNVKLHSPVRFKLKTVPDRVFTGQVSKIQAEPITNETGQRFYPVEVAVDNAGGILRPGMTGFARISFGRQAIGLIFAQKIWHSLRPELWLF